MPRPLPGRSEPPPHPAGTSAIALPEDETLLARLEGMKKRILLVLLFSTLLVLALLGLFPRRAG